LSSPIRSGSEKVIKKSQFSKSLSIALNKCQLEEKNSVYKYVREQGRGLVLSAVSLSCDCIFIGIFPSFSQQNGTAMHAKILTRKHNLQQGKNSPN
jgi:hypothetical protein